MSVETFSLLFGLALVCAGLTLALFSKAMARNAVKWHRRVLERPSTEIVTRIFYIIMGLFWVVFGILTMLGKTIK